MNVRRSYIALMLTVAVLGGAACKSQNTAEEQKKVDDLQKQLDDAKQQLAAKEGEIEAKAAETAAAPLRRTPQPAAPASEAGEAEPVTPQSPHAGQGHDRSQSRVETDLVDQQRDVNARQSRDQRAGAAGDRGIEARRVHASRRHRHPGSHDDRVEHVAAGDRLDVPMPCSSEPSGRRHRAGGAGRARGGRRRLERSRRDASRAWRASTSRSARLPGGRTTPSR